MISEHPGLFGWGEALETTTTSVVLGRLEVVEVAGDEAVGFLQGQLASDVEVLREGESAWSLLLEPDGSLGHLVRVAREAEARFVLVGALGDAEAVLSRLARFKLRVKASLALAGRAVAVGGPEAGSIVLSEPGQSMAVHLLAEEQGSDVPEVDEVARLEAWSLVRHELASADVRAGMNPFELGAHGVERAVSQTKGCYTGQELVARVLARAGSAPHRLCALTVEGPLQGAEVRLGGEEIGVLVRGVYDPEVDRSWATARVVRKAAPEGEVTCSVGELDGALSPL